MLARGAERSFLVDCAVGEDERVAEGLRQASASANLSDEDGVTALHYAAATLSAAVARRLLREGAEVNAVDRMASTALHRACNHRTRADRETLEALLGAGANVNARDKREVTPLHVAVRARNPLAVRVLLASGAEVDAVDGGRGTTPLRRAVANTGAGKTKGRQEDAFTIARLLLEHGADPHHLDKKGRPVIDSVSSRGMRALLERHAAR